MTRPCLNCNPIWPARQILDGLSVLLQTYLPLELKATRITPWTVWQVLLDASVQQSSIEASCERRSSAPSGNRLREVLLPALPNCTQLEDELNALLGAQLPRAVRQPKHRYAAACDISLIPYHGQPAQDESEVLRAEAKSGTNHFHAYATIALVHQQQRFVLAVHFVRLHEAMDETVRQLLNRVEALQIRLRRLLLDKEFYSVAVFQLLRERALSFVLPMPLRANSHGAQRLCRGRRSRWGRYRVQSRQDGSHLVRVAVVKRNRRPGQRKIVRWFLFAVGGLPARLDVRQVFQLYRQRFGIESSYRQMHQVRARTSSRSPALRLLFVGLALTLVNLYVQLRACLLRRPTRTRRMRRLWLTLKRLAVLLRQALESIGGLKPLWSRLDQAAFS